MKQPEIIRYRRANHADTAACTDILRNWITETEWMPMIHSRNDLKAFWANRLEKSESWVAENDNKVVGFCTCDKSLISALYINHCFRKKGIGTHLLDLLMQERGKLSLWVFQANETAIRFYEKAGFRAVRHTEGDSEEGLPDLYMEWRRDTV